MIGILLISIGTLFEEFATLIGKAKVASRAQSVYTMGFLQVFWVALIFLGIALLKPGSFIFQSASLPTFLPRVFLEVLQAHMTVHAIVLASRGAFGFIRSLTIPLLLAVDVILGYSLATTHFFGIGLILVTLFLLFANHGIEREGARWVVGTALNAAATLSLYKYNITHFNSVVAEQLIVYIIVMGYFFFAALRFAGENPFRFFRQPISLLQSGSMGIGVGFESFAFVFAPASVILAVKRSSAILWSIISGTFYFREKRFALKVGAFIVLAVGIMLLAL